MSGTETERKTRKVFDKIHIEQAENADISSRLRTLISTELLGVDNDFFEDKVCADLGCRSAVVGALNLLDLGAKFVHAMDLDDTFVETATSVLEAEPAAEGRWQLDVGSVSDLPYEDETFDYILCQGVLHHVEDDARALGEITRVLKKGGVASFEAHGRGGIFTRFGMEILRDEYVNNDVFHNLVDRDLNPRWISDQIDWLIDRVTDDGSKAYKDSLSLLEALRGLLDKDFILTLKDRVQAPTYKMYTQEEFVEMLATAGFSSWRRVSRKPVFSNIRKILAPVYFEYDAPLSQLLYGDGMLIFVANK